MHTFSHTFTRIFSHCSLHSYEFVKYLRQYVENSLGTVVEDETKNLTRGDGQHAVGFGHDTLIHAVTRRTRESVAWVPLIDHISIFCKISFHSDLYFYPFFLPKIKKLMNLSWVHRDLVWVLSVILILMVSYSGWITCSLDTKTHQMDKFYIMWLMGIIVVKKTCRCPVPGTIRWCRL